MCSDNDHSTARLATLYQYRHPWFIPMVIRPPTTLTFPLPYPGPVLKHACHAMASYPSGIYCTLQSNTHPLLFVSCTTPCSTVLLNPYHRLPPTVLTSPTPIVMLNPFANPHRPNKTDHPAETCVQFVNLNYRTMPHMFRMLAACRLYGHGRCPQGAAEFPWSIFSPNQCPSLNFSAGL